VERSTPRAPAHLQEIRQVPRIALIFQLRRWETSAGFQHHFRRFPSPSHHRTQTLGSCEIRTVSRCRGELPAESAESPGNTGQGPAEWRPDRHVLRSCNATAYSAVEQRYNLLGCGPFGRLVVISRSLHDLDAPAAGVNFGSDYRGAPGTHERRQIIALLTVGPLRSGPTFNACEVPDR